MNTIFPRMPHIAVMKRRRPSSNHSRLSIGWTSTAMKEPPISLYYAEIKSWRGSLDLNTHYILISEFNKYLYTSKYTIIYKHIVVNIFNNFKGYRALKDYRLRPLSKIFLIHTFIWAESHLIKNMKPLENNLRHLSIFLV